jgi:hypothetical protein
VALPSSGFGVGGAVPSPLSYRHPSKHEVHEHEKCMKAQTLMPQASSSLPVATREFVYFFFLFCF